MNLTFRRRRGRPLRVAVCLAEPWAYADGLCLDGIEVRAVRDYGRRTGADIRWLHVPEADVAQALASGRVDLCIGARGRGGRAFANWVSVWAFLYRRECGERLSGLLRAGTDAALGRVNPQEPRA